jgi:XRE family aerobic/anaerobic benzoate catabolism transcriptional regulator
MALAPLTGRDGKAERDVSAQGEDSAFLTRLGARVRRIRGQRGLSRKRLAESAGVSERYLAQLEAGRGNISILLLRHIAGALGLTLEGLVSDDPAAADIGEFLELLRRATPEDRRLARESLVRRRRRRDGAAVTRRVALIGLRGAGKSTLGRLVAADLGVPFVELNDEITKVSGLAVAEIFNLYGSEGYRRLERRCLGQVVEAHDSVVLASGGGIVSDSATYDGLLADFFTVWLRANPEEHMARVRAQGDLRPMAGHPEAMAELKLILAGREALYGRADRELDTSGRALEACRRELADLLTREVFAAAG